MHRRTVGIDLAISGVQVAQVFNDGIAVGKPIRFKLVAADLQRLVDTVVHGVPEGTPIEAVMEPAGMAWFPIATWLQRAGVKVIRVKGQRVKALRKYLSEHAKTDAADAHVLGSIPSFGGRTLDPIHVPAPDQHALQRLTKQRSRYQETICASRRRLLDLIRWACPALEPVLPDTMTRLTLALLSEFFDPQRVLKTRRDVLARFVSEHASGNHPHQGPFVDNVVEALKAAARETVALHADSIDFTALQFEVRQEVELLRMLDRNIVELERQTRSYIGNCIPLTHCARFPESDQHWHRFCSACWPPAHAFAISAISAASAACFQRRTRPRGSIALDSASPSAEATALSVHSTSPLT